MAKPVCEARVRDQILVAAFSDSNPPVVWQFDLNKNHSFAVAIQGKESDWHLGIVSPRGDFTSVARYEQRADVDTAWQSVRTAMLNPMSSGTDQLWRLAGVALLLFAGLCAVAAVAMSILLNANAAP